ncbi:uncharacterized protein LOC129987580 [Argiope bruennichi]|uniref:uncharacterized protein LOC129987580 n=1 Tax=Argiope bruennichi TaxID=94029 RepID=UPI0024951BE3|nr:uncharacterized protein LOC129987580 [Argiope bruennichi]
MDDPKRYKEHITQIKVARGKVKASLTRLEHSADELESKNEVVIRLQRINDQGRFVVRLPVYKDINQLEDTKGMTISRLLAMERKFKFNSEFEMEYKSFMREDEELGHMSPNKDFDSSKPDYFLPHHAVQKKDSITTKFRVVFDGSYSQVVLSWLSSPPRNWKPFVANRTSEILDLIPQNRWRFRSNMSKQKMGDLPEGRVTLNRPFFVCGIDYAGPISILKHRGRGAKTTKGYMVVFVCFATKALHLELVTDYTSDSFIAALKRFCSRRSTPKHIHSDNGTNFLGAKRKFKDLYNHLSKINLDQKVSYFLSQQEIEWHTIPPLSPHFGGLWEAGVKSAGGDDMMVEQAEQLVKLVLNFCE